VSAEAVGFVFRHSPYKGVTFAVHLAIADSVNDQFGNEFWMTVEKLASKSRTTRGTASRAVAEIEDDGFISLVGQRSQGWHSSRYRFLFPDTDVVYESRFVPVDEPCALDTVPEPCAETPEPCAPDTPSVRSEHGEPNEPKNPNNGDTRPLCEHLAARIGEFSGKEPKVTAKWLSDMDLLLRRGPAEWAKPEGLDPERVTRLIDFVFDNAGPSPDGFSWAAQVRAPSGLRKHYERLRQWANQTVKNGGRPHGGPAGGPTEEGWMNRSG